MIKQYRAKNNDLCMSKKFIFNAFDLQGIFDCDNVFYQGILKRVPTIKNGDRIADLTVEEVGISNNSNIFVIETEDVKGGVLGC